MKHRIEMSAQISIPMNVVYEVEFDDETGEADVISEGRVTQFREKLTRREVVESIEMGNLDTDVLARLIELEKLPFPKPGVVVRLGRHSYVLPDDNGDIEYEDLTVRQILDYLERAPADPTTCTALVLRKKKRRRG